jgi:uncharacterized RDD family membrane protein YckC
MADDRPEENEGHALDGEDDSPVPVYAAINLRARAFLIDAVVVGGGLALLIVLSLFLEDVPGFGRMFVMLFWALALLYEPLLVWRRGATIGHRRANIQVVSDATGGSPGFVTAFFRFLIKGFLGFPSFLAMAFTRRHQSVHDYLTRTTVQLRDPSIARSFDMVFDRDTDASTRRSPGT